jgi:hypothetical protein
MTYNICDLCGAAYGPQADAQNRLQSLKMHAQKCHPGKKVVWQAAGNPAAVNALVMAHLPPNDAPNR